MKKENWADALGWLVLVPFAMGCALVMTMIDIPNFIQWTATGKKPDGMATEIFFG